MNRYHNLTEDNLSAVVWNIFGMIYTIDKIETGELTPELLDKLPPLIRYRILFSRAARNWTEEEIKTIKEDCEKRS